MEFQQQHQLTQCVDGWQCGACGLSGVERDPPRKNAVPLEATCSGYVQGKLPWARNCSKIGISSAKCSSAKKMNNGREFGLMIAGCIRIATRMPEPRSREWPFFFCFSRTLFFLDHFGFDLFINNFTALLCFRDVFGPLVKFVWELSLVFHYWKQEIDNV